MFSALWGEISISWYWSKDYFSSEKAGI